MPVDPRVLQMISNPTAGRLGDIGKTIATNRQLEIDNAAKQAVAQENAKKAALDAQLKGLELTDAAAQTALNYSTNTLNWKKDNPDATDEEFASYQKQLYDETPATQKPFLKETTQSLVELERGKSNSLGYLESRFPDKYQKEQKSSFDLVTLADPEDINHVLSFHKDDKAAVKEKIDAGWTVRDGGQTINIGDKGATEYEKERMKHQAAAMSEIEKSSESAFNNIQALKRFKESSKEGYEGSLAPIMTGARNFVASFGYESEKLKDVRYMEQAVGEIQAQFMKELGARGLTDKDMEILRLALPRVSTDKASRDAVADILIKANSKSIEGFEEALNQESKMFPDLKVRKPKWLMQHQEYNANQDTFKKADDILRGL